jgi:3-oxoacyl-[acyl-carrier protein] reductase
VDLELADRVFIVTGGTAGLGLATARELAKEGSRLVVSSRREDAVAAAVAALGGPSCAVGLAADNGEEGTGQRLVSLALDSFGRLDGVLISSGGPPSGAFTAVTDEQWRAAFGSVFLGALGIARAAASALQPGGVIAFVLSSSVKSPLDELAISNGLRPGLAMVAKTLADELGPDGIRVLSLVPGKITTARTEELDGRIPGRREAAEKIIPLRRYGEPAEFGRVAAFLLSPAASYMSGVVIPVDGGYLRCI